MENFGFPAEQKMRLDREVERVRRKGRRVSDSLLILTWAEREATGSPRPPVPRIAIRVPRNVGEAVLRNRMKRLVREAFRLQKDRLRPGTDLLVGIKPLEGSDQLGYEDMRRRFEALCRKAGIWTD